MISFDPKMRDRIFGPEDREERFPVAFSPQNYSLCSSGRFLALLSLFSVGPLLSMNIMLGVLLASSSTATAAAFGVRSSGMAFRSTGAATMRSFSRSTQLFDNPKGTTNRRHKFMFPCVVVIVIISYCVFE